MADPPPRAGLHLVHTYDGDSPTREESAMADDVCDILADGLRSGSGEVGGGDAGGVEEVRQTTREQEEAARTEREFFDAIGTRLRERCSDWADGRRGLHVLELHEAGRRGWKFGVFDREGRLFEVDCIWSHLQQLAEQQSAGTFNNFELILNKVVNQFQDARRTYFARRDGVTLQ